MISKEIDPMQRRICSINTLNAGTVDNVIPDYAKMLISVRTFELDLDRFIERRIEQLSANAADELNGTVKISHEIEAYPVDNDAGVCKRVYEAARKVVGDDKITDMPVKMSSEDFSFYLAKKPGCFFGLGIKNEAKGIVSAPHNDHFLLDEAALIDGSKVFAQFVFDNMNMDEGDARQ
jgi:amidohydrolase